MLLFASDGAVLRACSARRLTIAWIPERVSGWNNRFRKIRSAPSRPAVKGRRVFRVTSGAVNFLNGTWRISPAHETYSGRFSLMNFAEALVAGADPASPIERKMIEEL